MKFSSTSGHFTPFRSKYSPKHPETAAVHTHDMGMSSEIQCETKFIKYATFTNVSFFGM